MLAAPAHDRGVVGDRLHGLGRLPGGAVASIGFDVFDRATEMHVIDNLRALELPGVAETEPLVRIFLLPALGDDLTEQTEIVTDAVADGGNRKRRHAFHETRRQSSQTAIAECRIRLAFPQLRQPNAEIAKRGLEHRQ